MQFEGEGEPEVFNNSGEDAVKQMHEGCIAEALAIGHIESAAN